MVGSKDPQDKSIVWPPDLHHDTRGCMHKRNRHLVDNSSACISYLTENKGGTFYTVNYAKSKGVEVINIAE